MSHNQTHGLDSETWTCAGPCHGQFIGRRPADDTCPACVALQVPTEASPVVTAMRALIDASSLGTPGAKALRDRADPAVTRQITDRAAALAGTGLVVPSGQTAEPLAALAASYPVAQARADLAAYAEHMAVPVAGLDDAAQRAHKLRDAEVVGCVVGSLAGLLSAIDQAAGA